MLEHRSRLRRIVVIFDHKDQDYSQTEVGWRAGSRVTVARSWPVWMIDVQGGCRLAKRRLVPTLGRMEDHNGRA